MPPFQEHCDYCNHVSTIPTRRTISLAPTSSARRRAGSPLLHPTTLCLILSILSSRFLALFKQSQATSDTAAHPSILFLAYLSFLFSMLGALSGSLFTRPPDRTITYQDQLAAASVSGPGRPISVLVITQSQMNACLPRVPNRLPVPSWLIQRFWDCSLMCTFASLSCLTAQVWLYICVYEPWSVQVVGGLAVTTIFSVAWRRLRTSCLFTPQT